MTARRHPETIKICITPQAFICPKGTAFPIFLSSHLLSFPLFHGSDQSGQAGTKKESKLKMKN
jgi:hypothetical protein